jgi:hypothetical protein
MLKGNTGFGNQAILKASLRAHKDDFPFGTAREPFFRNR